MSKTKHGKTSGFLSKSERAAYLKRWYYNTLVSFLLFSSLVCATLFIWPTLKSPTLNIWMSATLIGVTGQSISWGMLIYRHEQILDSLKWKRMNTQFTLPPSHLLCKTLALGCVACLFLKQIPLSFSIIMEAPPEYTPLTYISAGVTCICLVTNITIATRIKES